MSQPPARNRDDGDRSPATAPRGSTTLSSALYQHLYHHAPVIMALLDDSGTLLSVTEHWLEVFGCRREEAVGRSIGEFMTSSSRRKADEHVRPRFLKRRRVDDVRYRFISRAGGTFDGELSARRAPDTKGRMLTVAVIFDVTATHRARRELQGVNEQLTTTLNSIGEGVLSTDAEDQVRYLNPAGQRLLGISLANAVNRPLTEVYRRLERAKSLGTDIVPAAIAQGASADSSASRSAAVVLANHRGGRLVVEETVTPMCDAAGRVAGAVLVFRDVTAQRQLQQRISFQARHDALTGLFNRYEFESRIRDAIASAQASDVEHALLYLDLDRFKQVNDGAGHAAGDTLLRQLSIRLQGELRRGDTVARLGGDEFGVLLERCTQQQALRLSERLRRSVYDFRFRVGSQVFSVGASIGLVPIAGQAAVDVATTLRHADEACYAAKRAGRNQVRVHSSAGTPSISAGGVARASTPEVALSARLLRPLHNAVEGGHLSVRPCTPALDGVYPPSGDGVVPERWQLEELRRILRQPSSQRAEISLLTLHVTVSELDDQILLHTAHALLSESALRPSQICFEIPEHVARIDLEGALRFVDSLGGRGCRFALSKIVDAISEPAHLRQLPVDFLHIDDRFIQALSSDTLYRSSIRALTEMGRTLGMFSIASAVDDSSTIETLKELSVDLAEGDVFGAPLPLEEALRTVNGTMLTL
ncbi:MAG: diguanylate cyclase [Pseudomonadota bacterium]